MNKVKSLLFPALLIGVLFLKVEIVSPGEGIVEQSGGKIDIITPSSGVISALNATPNDAVEKNDVLFVVTDIEVAKKIQAIESSLAITKKKKDSLERDFLCLSNGNIDCGYAGSAFLAEKKLLIEKKRNIEHKKQDVESEIELLNKKEKLVKRKSEIIQSSNVSIMEKISDNIALSEFLLDKNKRKLEFESLSREANEIDVDIFSRQARTLNDVYEKLSSTKADEVRLNGEKIILESKKELNTVVSPGHGVVFTKGKNISNGSLVEKGQLILTLNMDGEGALVKGRFPSKYRAFLFQGMPIKGVLSTPGNRVVFSGVIESISSDSFKIDERNENNRYYEAVIAVSERNNYFHEGVGVSLFAVNKKVSLYEYLFGLFYSPLMFVSG
ncbi:MAG: HlyD family efflux transporter periplasmic adaptor subunit [Turicibacter sp.]